MSSKKKKGKLKWLSSPTNKITMKKISILCCLLLLQLICFAQQVVTWNFTAKKVANKIYDIYMVPTVKSPWHIYSQSSPEDAAVPTTIVFKKNPLVILEGKTKESGKVISKYESTFDATVKYFEGKVEFIQRVKLRSNIKTSVAGSVEFMACTDKQCLRPETIQFNVRLE